jgi:hypothetical protein
MLLPRINLYSTIKTPPFSDSNLVPLMMKTEMRFIVVENHKICQLLSGKARVKANQLKWPGWRLAVRQISQIVSSLFRQWHPYKTHDSTLCLFWVRYELISLFMWQNIKKYTSFSAFAITVLDGFNFLWLLQYSKPIDITAELSVNWQETTNVKYFQFVKFTHRKLSDAASYTKIVFSIYYYNGEW